MLCGNRFNTFLKKVFLIQNEQGFRKKIQNMLSGACFELLKTVFLVIVTLK